MTPARFDFLFVAYKVERLLSGIRQQLGLARQTVWKTMQRLIELGWITKFAVRVKGHRYIKVSFTDEGVRRMKMALGAAFNERLSKRMIRAAGTNRADTATDDATHVDGEDSADESPASASASKEADDAGEANGADDDVGGAIAGLRASGAAQPTDDECGREVGKIYSGVAWRRTTRGRQRRRRYIEQMEELIESARSMARALGDDIPPIYRFNPRENVDSDILITSIEWVQRGGRTVEIVKSKRFAYADEDARAERQNVAEYAGSASSSSLTT